MKLAIFLLGLLFIQAAGAATLYGTIYDMALDKVSDAIIEIDTTPNQQFIAKNGTYSFDVLPGEYLLKARSQTSKASERIIVEEEGKYIVDLVLFPEIESGLVDELSAISVEDNYFEKKPNYMAPVLAGLLMSVAFGSYLFFRKKKVVRAQPADDDYTSKVLSIIKENKRITQKEIRKSIPLSEAKISLIITELEHKGIVEKVKKGRGNVIILK